MLLNVILQVEVSQLFPFFSRLRFISRGVGLLLSESYASWMCPFFHSWPGGFTGGTEFSIVGREFV